MAQTSILVDKGVATVVATCPHCPYRNVSHDEVEARRLLRRHLYGGHSKAEAQRTRDGLNRWFTRHGLRAA